MEDYELKVWPKILSEKSENESWKEKVAAITKQKEVLKAARSFLEKGLKTPQARLYHKQQILQFCEVVERKPDLVFPMTEDQHSGVITLDITRA